MIPSHPDIDWLSGTLPLRIVGPPCMHACRVGGNYRYRVPRSGIRSTSSISMSSRDGAGEEA